MSRILLNYFLPILIPLAVYLLWTRLSGRRRGDDAISLAEEGPWFWILFSGFFLAAAGLVWLALVDNNGIEGIYQAPRIENGMIIPGTIDTPE